VLRNVFVCGRHVWLNKYCIFASLPETITEAARGRHTGSVERVLVNAVIVG
jgi:hypothetical protein